MKFRGHPLKEQVILPKYTDIYYKIWSNSVRELLVEFPSNLKDSFPKVLEKIMFNAAAKYCKKLPIPAEAEVSNCWLH